MTKFYTPEEAIRIIRGALPVDRIEVSEETLLIIAYPRNLESPIILHIHKLEGSGYATINQIANSISEDCHIILPVREGIDKHRIKQLCDGFIGAYFPDADKAYENIKPNQTIQLGRSNVGLLKGTEMELVVVLVSKDSTIAKQVVDPYLLDDPEVAMRTAYRQGFKLYDLVFRDEVCVARIRPAPRKNNYPPGALVRVIGTDFWINLPFLVMLRETSSNNQETKFIVAISERSNVELSSFFTLEDIVRNLS